MSGFHNPSKKRKLIKTEPHSKNKLQEVSKRKSLSTQARRSGLVSPAVIVSGGNGVGLVQKSCGNFTGRRSSLPSSHLSVKKSEIRPDEILPSYLKEFDDKLHRLKTRHPPDLLFEAMCVAADLTIHLPEYDYTANLRPPSQRIKQRKSEKQRQFKIKAEPIPPLSMRPPRPPARQKPTTFIKTEPIQQSQSSNSDTSSTHRNRNNNTRHHLQTSAPTSFSQRKTKSIASSPPTSCSSHSYKSNHLHAPARAEQPSVTSDHRHQQQQQQQQQQQPEEEEEEESDCSISDEMDEEEHDASFEHNSNFLSRHINSVSYRNPSHYGGVPQNLTDYMSSPLPPLLNLTPGLSALSPESKAFVQPVRPAVVSFVSPVLAPKRHSERMSPLKGSLSPIGQDFGRYGAFKSPERGSVNVSQSRENLSQFSLPQARDLSMPPMNRAMSDGPGGGGVPPDEALILSTLKQQTVTGRH